MTLLVYVLAATNGITLGLWRASRRAAGHYHGLWADEYTKRLKAEYAHHN